MCVGCETAFHSCQVQKQYLQTRGTILVYAENDVALPCECGRLLDVLSGGVYRL